MTAPATEELLGAAKQPKSSPADPTHTTNLEGEGYMLAEEGATHTQIVVAEVGLSQWHPQAPAHNVHMQSIGAEPLTLPGEPNTINEVVHAQAGAVE